MTRTFWLAFLVFALAWTSGASCQAQGYLLSPDDQIDISVLGHDEFKAGVTLLPDGTFNYPLMGRVHAAGQTVDELTAQLARGLSRQLNQPQVTVTLREDRQRKVSVLGNGAKTPGQYDCKTGMHLLDLIAVSGGPASSPELVQAMLVTNGGSQTLSVDLPKLLSHADMAQNLPLAPGDVLFLTPRAASETSVQVVGEVARPGAYETPFGGISLLSLISLAGGATAQAALTQAQVMHGGSVTICNLRPLLTRDLGDAHGVMRLVPGDVLLIPANKAHVLALGEVALKGVYPIPDGETLPLTVALAQVGGITADGDKKHLSIVRRRADGEATVLAVDMDDLLSGRNRALDIRLEAGDILYVPSRRHPKSVGDILTSLSPLAILSTLSHL